MAREDNRFAYIRMSENGFYGHWVPYYHMKHSVMTEKDWHQPGDPL